MFFSEKEGPGIHEDRSGVSINQPDRGTHIDIDPVDEVCLSIKMFLCRPNSIPIYTITSKNYPRVGWVIMIYLVTIKRINENKKV